MNATNSYSQLSISNKTKAQQTQIRGFVEAHAFFEDDKLSFGIGEQDLFITSQLSDRFSFLGETVFKFSSSSPTHFSGDSLWQIQDINSSEIKR